MNKSKQRIVYALATALLLPAALMAGETSNRSANRKEAIKLTERVEGVARKIQAESELLRSMQKNTAISNHSHQSSLHIIATHINEDLGPTLVRLAELQPELPQWKQDAIQKMRTSAANLAANTDAAVRNRYSAGTRQPAILDSEYQRLLHNMNGQAEALVQMADATADYGDAQLKGHRAGLAIATHD